MQQLRRTTFFSAHVLPEPLAFSIVHRVSGAGISFESSDHHAPGNQFERFRSFWEFFRRFEFEFCRRGNYISHFLFFVCSESIYIQCDFTCTCVVACFHEQMQTHNGKKRERERKHFHFNCGCVLDDS